MFLTLMKCVFFLTFSLGCIVHSAKAQSPDHDMPVAGNTISHRLNNADISQNTSVKGSVKAGRCSEVNIGSVVLKNGSINTDKECYRASNNDSRTVEVRESEGRTFEAYNRGYDEGVEQYSSNKGNRNRGFSVGTKVNLWHGSTNLEDMTGWDWGSSEYHDFLKVNTTGSLGVGCFYGGTVSDSNCFIGALFVFQTSFIHFDDGGELNELLYENGLGFINANVFLEFGSVDGYIAGPFRWSEEDGLFVGAKAGARAYAVEAGGGLEIELFDLFGKKAVICSAARGGFGAEASGGAYYENNRVKFSGGLALGWGGAITLCVGLVD